MNKIKSLKSKIITTLACTLIYFITGTLFQTFFYTSEIFEFQITNGLPIAFGLLFGPYGALGILIGDFFLKFSQGHNLEIIILSPIIHFIGGYISYKIWYSIKISEDMEIPRLNNVNSLIKLLIVIIISSIVISAMFGFISDTLIISNLEILDNLYYFFSVFDYSIILAVILISITSFYKIPLSIPSINKKPRFNLKFFNVSLIIAIGLNIIYIIYYFFFGESSMELLIAIVFSVLIIIYCLKPLKEKIKEKYYYKVPLTEKLIISIIATGVVLSILICSIVYLNTLTIFKNNFDFWQVIFFYITIILALFYLLSIVLLKYIEKNISYPIELLSSLSMEYIKTNNSLKIIEKLEIYCNDKNEVGILLNSFKDMLIDFEKYLEKLKEITSEKEKRKTELEIAYNIQSSQIPKNFKDFSTEKYDIYGINIPAKEVGGDFYDFFLIDDDHLAIIIADVSGKGIPAALFMMASKTLINDTTALSKKPSEIFYEVNNLLCENNDENMFVTSWMGILEISSGKLTYTNAGHENPLVYENNKYSTLESKPHFILGGFEDIDYEDKTICLKKNNRIFLYTDGITEANNKNNELFGVNRLIETLNKYENEDIESLIIKIKEELERFTEDTEQFDDITMLILEYK
ncbi:PP2C family protein-serine/threonine phosphatase [Methanobrevibacter sp. DSM 116169]|uniref:PP2C family protein-serine/threonine phosphatase n=1 Tax=Methanobrevibacter sp. DSM 116169 TaxID=3242727 RepID=UPI0038FC981E